MNARFASTAEKSVVTAVGANLQRPAHNAGPQRRRFEPPANSVAPRGTLSSGGNPHMLFTTNEYD
jgi:hypothetical protein